MSGNSTQRHLKLHLKIWSSEIILKLDHNFLNVCLYDYTRRARATPGIGAGEGVSSGVGVSKMLEFYDYDQGVVRRDFLFAERDCSVIYTEG